MVSTHELEEVRAERRRLHPEGRGVIPGAIEAAPADETQGTFVVLRHKEVEKAPEEGKGEQQQQQQKE
jgi:hypothetical protein